MEKVVYGVTVDLSYEHKTGCPKCISKGNDQNLDNLHVYGQDAEGRHRGAKCFACTFYILSEEYKESIKEDNEPQEYEYMGTEFNEEIHRMMKESTGTDSKGYRGIRTAISRSLGVRYEYDQEDGSVAKTFYPVTKDCLNKEVAESIVGYKVRTHPKSFFEPLGETGKDCDLFMQWKFKTHKGMLLVCGGEHDALAAYQMLLDMHNRSNGKDKYDEVAVVSGTTGEGGVANQLRQQYQWLTQFSKIIICMDEDKAGDKATEEVAKILPKGKAFVMKMRHKDPNEYIVKGDEQSFVNDFWGHKPYVPVGIVGSSSLLDEVLQSAKIEKIPLPPFMHKLQNLMAGGIPLGVILNLGSASGTGKSTYVEELTYYWVFNSPYKVGVLSLESDQGEYGTKLLSRHISRKINLIVDADEKVDFLNSEFVQEKARELFTKPDGRDRFYLMDERGGNVKDIQDAIERMVKECQCKVIVIDPLQDVIASLPLEEQDNFMSWQKSLTKSEGVTVINISHVRKSSGGKEANSRGADISEEDFHGSGSIFKSGACNLLFTRNKESESAIERNTTIMKMTKCRWTGNTSPFAGMYYYDNSTHTLHDFEEWKENNPHMFKEE